MPKFLTLSAVFAAAALSACAGAQAHANGLTDVCGQALNHVQVEQGHISPPILLLPDVGGDFDTSPQQEWNYLGTLTDPITVHCFPNADKSGQKDVNLPANTKRCILNVENVMSCGG